MSYFSPSGSAGAPGTPVDVILEKAATPAVDQVSMVIASTEYSYTFPIGCKQFLLKLRNNTNILQVAYVSGQSGSMYVTIPRGNFYSEGDLNLTSTVTLYFQSNEALQTLEIVYWT